MPAPRPLHLLMLDCDGVLIRSRLANLAYYNYLFDRFDLPVVSPSDEGNLSLLHTLSTPQVIEAFFPPELRGRAFAAAAEVDYRRFLPLVESEPGWDDVLPRLRRVFPIAVATNRGDSALEVLAAAGILEHVDAVVTSRQVARPKPAPDLLLKALERFGASAAESLYVGDAELDRLAAAAAGTPFVGFRFPEVFSVASPWELESFLSNGHEGRSVAQPHQPGRSKR